MTTVTTRPPEETALFNPAFLAVLVRSAVVDHVGRAGGRGFPVALAYVTVPLALHGPTRRSLPGIVTAQMGEWTRLHPEALAGLANRVVATRPLVSAGLQLALTSQAVLATEGALLPGERPRRPRGMRRSDEVEECIAKAAFLGRWFAEQPDYLTAMALWGLRP